MTSPVTTVTSGTAASTSDSTPGATRTRASIRTLGVGLGLGALAVIITNGLVFAIADLGAPVQVATDPKVIELGLADILVASVMWLVVGAAGLWVSEKLFARGFLIWSIGAAVIAVASIAPVVALDVDAGSKVALSVLHVVVAAAAIAGQAVARRRTA